MEINAKELARLLELKRRKAELEFKKSLVGLEDEKELDSVSSGMLELSKKANAAGIEMLLPKQEKIDELDGRLKGFSAEQIKEALKDRSGEVYGILSERSRLLKENHENRLEIAKLSMITAKMNAEERQALANAIRSGGLDGQLSLDSLAEGDRGKLARFMQRCGMECMLSGNNLLPSDGTEEKEVRLEVSHRNVWVSEEVKEKLEGNLKRIKEITPEIQLRNAQRHIKIFNDDEEEAFASLQREYLELLKEQDELLRVFNEEETLSVKA